MRAIALPTNIPTQTLGQGRDRKGRSLKTIATATQTTVNEILEAITNHPAGYLVEIKHEMFGGKYPRVYPAKLAIEGNDWVFATNFNEGFKPIRKAEDVVEFLDKIAQESSCAGWAEQILRQNSWHTDPFASTKTEDEQRFISAEKLFFQKNYSADSSHRSFIVGDYKVTFRFWVTSFHASIGVRGTFSPEAAGAESGSHQRSDEFLAMAKFCWGENDSGFNQKYIEAIAFLKRFIAGNWEGVSPLYQSNRSSSINARTGEHSTRFWDAQLTFPEKAKEKSAFPLFVSRLIFP